MKIELIELVYETGIIKCYFIEFLSNLILVLLLSIVTTAPMLYTELKFELLLINNGLCAQEILPINRPPLSPLGYITLLISLNVFWLETAGDLIEGTCIEGIC